MTRSEGESGPARPFRQTVPRPVWARPGAPAPWAGTDRAGAAEGLDVESVVGALRAGLLPIDDQPEVAVKSAVLIALFDRDGEATVLLIRRALGLRNNPGEVAFPGGRLEPGEDALSAALRETEEEIGLPRSLVEVIGRLPVRERMRRPGAIVPYVGILGGLPELQLYPDEVDAVLLVPVQTLLREGVHWEEEWNPVGSPPFALHFFADPAALGDDLVWGATARMLFDLVSLIETALG